MPPWVVIALGLIAIAVLLYVISVVAYLRWFGK